MQGQAHPKGSDMKSVFLGIGAAIVLSLAAWLLTGELDSTSAERFTSPNNSVRLD